MVAQPHAHPHPHPHPAPHSRLPVNTATRRGPLLAGIAVMGAAVGLALVGINRHHVPKPQELLLDQIHEAAAGTAVSPHAFGGSLSVEKSNGRINVVVEGLPTGPCVEAGWQLAREGTVIVNGVLPQRISAAKLSELCSLEPKGARLVWAPEN